MPWVRCIKSCCLSWGRLTSLLTTTGPWLLCQICNTRKSLCAVLSEKGMHLILFPFIKDGDEEVLDCLVFPEFPLFLNVQGLTNRSTTYQSILINHFLLLLLLVWTKEGVNFYRDGLFNRERINLPNGTKKSAIKPFILTAEEKELEIMQATMAEQQATMAEQQAAMAEQQAMMAEQQAMMAEQEEQIRLLNEKIRELEK